jgi:hypothetical protein
MYARGPGEGYGAAKGDALALRPTLVCKRVMYGSQRLGYVVLDPTEDDRQYGRGAQPRDAWGEAFWCLKNNERPSLERDW